MNTVLSEKSKRRIKKKIADFDNLPEQEQILKTIKVVADDFYLYCERNLVIKNKDGEITPLKPNLAQRKLVDYVLKCILEGKPVRVMVLKARQLGFSTIIEALGYWWTATHKNIVAVITAHEKDAASNIYKMFRRFYEYTHEMWKPTTKYDTKSDLTFNNDDGKGLNSVIKTTVADKGAGRSDTIQFLHGSEVAFWKDGYDIMAGLMQAIPLKPKTFVFLESTANGTGGYFYDQWQQAKRGESVFEPFFFAWHEHPEYELDGKIDSYTEDENDLLKLFEEKKYAKKSWDRKLMWRRYKIKEMQRRPGLGSQANDLFRQEYPANDVEAFLASGRPVFDLKVLVEMEKAVKEPRQALLSLENRNKVEVRWVKDSPLKVWEEPQPAKKYVIGVDTAEGDVTGDYSVIDVLRTDTLTTVARWRGHTDADLLGEETYLLGTWYNTALVGVESNNHGLTTLTDLKNRYYRNLYQRERGVDEWFETPTGKLGWRTDRKTKPLMIDDLSKAIREREIVDYDPIFIRECMTYVVDDAGRTNAQDGTHDDTVIAKAIALQMFTWQNYDRSHVKSYKNPKFVKKRAQV